MEPGHPLRPPTHEKASKRTSPTAPCMPLRQSAAVPRALQATSPEAPFAVLDGEAHDSDCPGNHRSAAPPHPSHIPPRNPRYGIDGRLHEPKPAHRPSRHGNPSGLSLSVTHVRKEPGAHAKGRETIPVSFLGGNPLPMSSKTKPLRSGILAAAVRGFPSPPSLPPLARARTFASSVPQGKPRGRA